MKIRTQISIMLVVFLILIGCSGSSDNIPLTKKDFKSLFMKHIPVTALESAGFEHISPADFDLLIDRGIIYILCMQDRVIAKFEGDNLKKVYKTSKGQGPREMLAPKSIFYYDDITIAVHDYLRKSIVSFDCDLTYLKEIKIPEGLLKIARTDCGIVASLSRPGGHVFGFLDKDFRTTGTFAKKYREIPFEKYYEIWLNQAFFVNGGLVAHTHGLQPEKKCIVDMYELDTKKLNISLAWEQPHTPTEESISARKDLYFTNYVGKLGKHYVIQNSHFKSLMSPKRDYDLLVFNEAGKITFKCEFPYQILRSQSVQAHSKIYVIDEDEDICVVDIKDIIN